MSIYRTILICFLIIPASLISQVPSAVLSRFQRQYNNQEYDSLHASFSPEMKNALPLIQARNFFMQLSKNSGRIRTMEFNRVENGFSVYKTNFERALYAVNLSVDEGNRLNGLLVVPFTDKKVSALKRNKTTMALPFTGEWTVFWGGDNRQQNYHVDNPSQKGAFDLLITDASGKTFRNSGRKNEDYYAFGKPVLAPCDGEIVLVVDGIKDNTPGKMNTYFVTGNTVVLKTINNEYLVFAHFRQNSIRVKQGEKVKRGSVLGNCGNSGNSSEPHLHFHMQDREDLDEATGIKIYFESILVNGVIKKEYSPVKNERIRNR